VTGFSNTGRGAICGSWLRWIEVAYERMRRRSPAAGLLAMCLALTACGGGEAPEAETEPTVAEPAAIEVSGDVGEKPTVEIPDEPARPTLETKDIVVGKGPEAKAGDTLEVDYVGLLYDSGEEFDSSFERGKPFVFELGRGMVIPGWDQGLEGMKKGGRRLLEIPPELAYGPQGSPPVIGPNEALVFVVDLVEIR
jgi:peptidylprolyl isomerase